MFIRLATGPGRKIEVIESRSRRRLNIGKDQTDKLFKETARILQFLGIILLSFYVMPSSGKLNGALVPIYEGETN